MGHSTVQVEPFGLDKAATDKEMFKMAQPGPDQVLNLLPGGGQVVTPFTSNPGYKGVEWRYTVVPTSLLGRKLFG